MLTKVKKVNKPKKTVKKASKKLDFVKLSKGKKKGPVKLSTKNSVTYVALVVDRSGSMASIYAAALDGVNEQINTLKQSAKDLNLKTFVTVIQFDEHIETLYSQKDALELEPFKHGDFYPRGTTAMRDGVYKAIQDLESITNAPDDVGYLVVVISDGLENASREITQEALATKAKQLQDTGKWTFTYMLANQDITAVSRALNIPLNNVSSFVATNAGVAAAYTTTSGASAGYMSLRSSGVTSSQDFYNKGTTTIPTVNTTATVILDPNAAATVATLKTKKLKVQQVK